MASKTFADALKEARRTAGLTQASLARRAGLTGSYISVLESRRRRPPSPKVIRSLCRALGIDEKPLQELAALERSPPTVRRRLERMRRERGRVHQTRDHLLATTLFHLSRRPRVIEPMAEFLDLPVGQQALLARLLGRLRKVRNLDEVESKTDVLLEDASTKDRDALTRLLPGVLADDPSGRDAGSGSAIAAEDAPVGEEAPVTEDAPVGEEAGKEGAATRRVPVHADLSRRREPETWRVVASEGCGPAFFFWRASGDDAHPRIEAGDLLLIDPGARPEEGDVVVLRQGSRDRVGVFHRKGAEVHVLFPRPEIPPIRLRATDFRPAGVVVRLVREMR